MHRRQAFLAAVLVLACGAPAAAASAPAERARATRTRIALLGLNAGEGIGEKTAAIAEEMLLNALHRTGRFAVVGRSDIANLIGFERQKQLIGCKEDTSCAAEIAGALGVALVASASLGRVGPLTVVSLKVIEVASARVLARSEVRSGDEAELPAALDRLVADAVAGCEMEGCFGTPVQPAAAPAAALAPEPVAPVSASWRTRLASRRFWAWVALGAGAATAVAGGIVGWQARSITSGDGQVRGIAGSHSITQAEAARQNDLGLAANILFGSAAALGAGGAALFVF